MILIINGFQLSEFNLKLMPIIINSMEKLSGTNFKKNV